MSNSNSHNDFGHEAERLLKWLGGFGSDPNGGASRLLYTPEWVNAQNALMRMMKDEGLSVQFDEVGNLFGRLEGIDNNETIMTGSHIDTVKNGGLYDGQYGIVAGLIAMRHLKHRYGQPLRNLELVSFAEEEGSRFPYVFWGVKNLFGLAERGEVEGITDSAGVSFVEAMRSAGFDFRKESAEIRNDIKAFLEIHIEQGGVLEAESKSVGVVQHIVGQRRFTIELLGEPNHAGTTPMRYRKDAVKGLSLIVSAIMDRAIAYGDPLVATVGRIEIQPNVANVVPGKATFTLDVRHTHKEILVRFTDEATVQIKDIASREGLGVNIDMWMNVDPVPMNDRIVEAVKSQCERNGLNYRMMHSGAGHDSQIVAKFVPTGMLFVPSRKGISHSPLEYTSPNDLGEGVKALVAALYDLAYEK
jgi:allantoate deiminase